MLIAISIDSDQGLQSAMSQIFGRCSYFLLVDPQTRSFSVSANSAQAAAGGAGIQAAQFLLDQQVNAVISANLGPKAQALLQSAGVACYQFSGGSANDTLDAFEKDQLKVLNTPNVDAHSGMRG